LLHSNICFDGSSDVGMTGRGVGVVVAALLVAVISVIAAMSYILYRYVLTYHRSKSRIMTFLRIDLGTDSFASRWLLLLDAFRPLFFLVAIGRRKSLKQMKSNGKKLLRKLKSIYLARRTLAVG
jgi:hypothetical protein